MLFGFVNIIGGLLFLYLTWRNLRDDYEDEKLISYSWLAILVMFLGGRLTYGLANWGVWNDSLINWVSVAKMPGFSLFGSVLAWGGFTFWYCQISLWKTWAFFEDIIPIYYVLLASLLIGGYTYSDSLTRLIINLLIIVGAFVLAKLIKGKYRSFVWYKSGKKGFLFFFVNFFVGLAITISSLIYKDSIYLTSLYLIVSLISLVELFILGEVFNNSKK